MTEREKLLKICKEGHNAYLKYQNPNPRYDEFLTDYLLENGVIVPPLDIGDKVYIIDRRFEIIEYKVTQIKYDKDLNGQNIYYDAVTVSKDDNNFGFFDSDIGKYVFSSKEEAEKALRERETNG